MPHWQRSASSGYRPPADEVAGVNNAAAIRSTARRARFLGGRARTTVVIRLTWRWPFLYLTSSMETATQALEEIEVPQRLGGRPHIGVVPCPPRHPVAIGGSALVGHARVVDHEVLEVAAVGRVVTAQAPAPPSGRGCGSAPGARGRRARRWRGPRRCAASGARRHPDRTMAPPPRSAGSGSAAPPWPHLHLQAGPAPAVVVVQRPRRGHHGAAEPEQLPEFRRDAHAVVSLCCRPLLTPHHDEPAPLVFQRTRRCVGVGHLTLTTDQGHALHCLWRGDASRVVRSTETAGPQRPHLAPRAPAGETFGSDGHPSP